METKQESQQTSSATLGMTSPSIEDSFLRKALINACLSLEEQTAKGKPLDRKLTMITPWGLEINVSMEQPREDKPVIFRFGYRVRRAKFYEWLTEHTYLLEDAFGFSHRGITIMVPGPGVTKYHKTSFVITIKYQDTLNVDASLDLLNKTTEFVVHRDVVSNNEWIITADIE